jgi:hypothetical protein
MRQNYPPRLSEEPKIEERFEGIRKHNLITRYLSLAGDSTRPGKTQKIRLTSMQVIRCANPDLSSNLPVVLGNGREGDNVVEMQSAFVKYSIL